MVIHLRKLPEKVAAEEMAIAVQNHPHQNRQRDHLDRALDQLRQDQQPDQLRLDQLQDQLRQDQLQDQLRQDHQDQQRDPLLLDQAPDQLHLDRAPDHLTQLRLDQAPDQLRQDRAQDHLIPLHLDRLIDLGTIDQIIDTTELVTTIDRQIMFIVTTTVDTVITHIELTQDIVCVTIQLATTMTM